MPTFGIGMLLALRFSKLAAVFVFAAGTIGAFVARDSADRRRFAYGLAGPGFLVTVLLGFLLAAGSGVSLLAPWIAGAVVLSIVCINAVLWSVGREGRRSLLAGAIAIGALFATLALMVWKPG